MVNYSISLAPQDGIKVNIKYRFGEEKVVDFITNLDLYKPPCMDPLSFSGSTQELEQHLHYNFPTYTFAFKQKKNPTYSSIPIEFNNLKFKVEEEYFYIKGESSTYIKQENLFLLSISSAKSLLHKLYGEQKYLVLKLIQVENKVKFIETEENYV